MDRQTLRSPEETEGGAETALTTAGRHLNFRLAAEELGVTHGAVAQQVRGLEANLGLPLFERGARGLSLTASGQTYADQIRRALDLVEEATASIRADPMRLTISVTPTFASKWLIPRLPEFTTLHPEIELRALATEGISDFRADKVDLAIRQGPSTHKAGLDSSLFLPQRIVAVRSPALMEKDEIDAEDLCRFPLLEDAHAYWARFAADALGFVLPRAAKRLQFSQTSLAIEAAVGGQGIAVTSEFLVDREIEAGRLVRASSAFLAGEMDAYVVTLQKPLAPALTQHLKDWLLSHGTVSS